MVFLLYHLFLFLSGLFFPFSSEETPFEMKPRRNRPFKFFSNRSRPPREGPGSLGELLGPGRAVGRGGGRRGTGCRRTLGRGSCAARVQSGGACVDGGGRDLRLGNTNGTPALGMPLPRRKVKSPYRPSQKLLESKESERFLQSHSKVRLLARRALAAGIRCREWQRSKSTSFHAALPVGGCAPMAGQALRRRCETG